MSPKLSTVVGSLFPLLLAYFFIYAPLFGKSSSRHRADQDCDLDILSTLDHSLVQISPNVSCPEHSYNVHIANREPLVVYISHFLTDAEAEHLVNISLPNFSPSTVYDGRSAQVNTQVRRSEVALLPDSDVTVQCLAQRAQAFQGFSPSVYIEKMRAQRYGPSGHYSHHYDWTGASRKADRVSTFMVYLQADCLGGGTNFPRLRKPKGKEWCRWIECDNVFEGDELVEGVTFKPLKGSAVYFENLRPNGGGGYEETFHAALPVKEGTKIGLNVWSWMQQC